MLCLLALGNSFPWRELDRYEHKTQCLYQTTISTIWIATHVQQIIIASHQYETITSMKSSPVSTAAHTSYISDLTETTALHKADKTHTSFCVVFMLQDQSSHPLETASVQWPILSKPWPHKSLLQNSIKPWVSPQLVFCWKLVWVHLSIHVEILSQLCWKDFIFFYTTVSRVPSLPSQITA